MISGTITTLFVSGVSVIFTLFLQPMLLTGGGPYDGLSSTIAMFIVNAVNANDLYHAAATGMIFTVIGIPLVQLVKWGMERIFPTVDY
jgi:ABC-type sugar transport system permease subunit